MTKLLENHGRTLVILFIATQLLLPTGLLVVRWVDEGLQPTSVYPFSWQMYSTVDEMENVKYSGVTSDGMVIPLDTDHLPRVTRVTVYGEAVLVELCAANPNLVEVKRLHVDNASRSC